MQSDLMTCVTSVLPRDERFLGAFEVGERAVLRNVGQLGRAVAGGGPTACGFGFTDGSWGTLLVPQEQEFLTLFPGTLTHKERIP
ncbi:hypothetical protein [Streptomyces lydicus]|uniref:hypothetical protein n=1 Tax=Streptomyces lydicus TaxID=47763 RepID=UPI003794B702